MLRRFDLAAGEGTGMERPGLRAVLAALLALIPMAVWLPASAQETTEASAAAEADSGLLTPDEIDTLMAPVALFPDALLTQVMMATTFPLDVVKADRFIADAGDISDEERAKAVQEKDWDPSVQALAAGFPTLVTRMADHIDWTEQVGQAVLVQTEDVLDSVQRLRAEASQNGYLDSNGAQTVTVENDIITIAPASPEVVYVPTYDPQVVYSTPAPAVPYVVSDGDDWGDALAAGAIFFGTAIILDEIFDNDDDWNDYWHGSRPIDWNNGDFYARPGIGINGDVNIDRGDINIDRNRITNIDRDAVNIDRQRPGSLDRDQIDKARDKSFNPDAADRDAARAKIENRQARGDGVATLPAPGAARDAAPARGTAGKPKVNKPAAGTASANRSSAKLPQTSNRPANVSKPQTVKRPTASKPSPKSGSFNKSGGSRAQAAGNRGRASSGGGGRRR
jgi:hypothetical protein